MANNKKAKKMDRASRLDLIRKRHQELILSRRKSLEEDFDAEFDSLLDEDLEVDRLELSELAEVERL